MKPAAAQRFWANRALRLYPVYLFVAAVALAFRLLTDPDFLAGFAALPSAAQAALWLANLVLFGQDWLMFLGVVNGHLVPVMDFRASQPELWTFLLIPPAWSLGVELAFYALAPFLLKLRSKQLAVIIAASIVLRAGLFIGGLSKDPWSYRFFPSEVALFLIGSVAYRAMKYLYATRPGVFAWGREATVLVAAYIAGYAFLPGPEVIKRGALLISLAALLPLIFEYSRRNTVDRYIGELSYPLYISHWTVLAIAAHFVGKPMSMVAGIAVAVTCVFVALVLCIAVDNPVQQIRSRVRRSSSEAKSTIAARAET